MPVSVSSAARAAVLARLAESFNAAHAVTAAAAGAKPFTIDWTKIFESFLNPDDIEDTSAFTWPVVCLYTAPSRNKNRAKYNVFSGEVDVYVDFHLSTLSASAPRKLEIELDAIENAHWETFNRGVAWGPDHLVYNGDMDILRLPAKRAGQNWRQTIRARLIIELDSN